jgi:hypothetical protein
MGQKQCKKVHPEQVDHPVGSLPIVEEKGLFEPDTERSLLYNTFQIPRITLRRALHNARNNRPIIIDIYGHGAYDTRGERSRVDNFLLTLSGTGHGTDSKFLYEFLSIPISNTYTYERYLPGLLNGNLKEIQEKTKRLDAYIKNETRGRLNSYEKYDVKLYHSKGSPHFNKSGTKIRRAKTDKNVPPILCQFRNSTGGIGDEKFYTEPAGVYLIENRSNIYKTFDYGKISLHYTFNTDQYAGVLSAYTYEKLLKKLGKTDPNIPNRNSLSYKNNMLINYFNSVDSPQFNFVKNNSMFIPDPTKFYRIDDIMREVTKKMRAALKRIDPSITNPVILYTFLNCKYIQNNEERRLFSEMSNALDDENIRKVRQDYKDYVSSMLSNEQMENLAVATIQRLPSNSPPIRRSHVLKTRRRQRSPVGRSPTRSGSGTRKKECKGRPQEECVGPDCQWINGKKLKYCKRRTRRKARAGAGR